MEAKKPVQVPDAVGALVGYKFLRPAQVMDQKRRKILLSPGFSQWWEPRAVQTFQCHCAASKHAYATTAGHKRPGPATGCGFYVVSPSLCDTVASRKQAIQTLSGYAHQGVLARIAGWGHCQRGSEGFRAEFATVTGLVYFNSEAHPKMRELANAYEVDLIDANVALPDFVKFISKQMNEINHWRFMKNADAKERTLLTQQDDLVVEKSHMIQDYGNLKTVLWGRLHGWKRSRTDTKCVACDTEIKKGDRCRSRDMNGNKFCEACGVAHDQKLERKLSAFAKDHPQLDIEEATARYMDLEEKIKENRRQVNAMERERTRQAKEAMKKFVEKMGNRLLMWPDVDQGEYLQITTATKGDWL